MRINVKIGDIFEIPLNGRGYSYFQFVARDVNHLSADVIRVFKSKYDHRPTIEDIISDNIDFYSYTFLKSGVKFGNWIKIGHKDDVGSIDIWFKDSMDYGYYPKQIIVSEKWEVWRVNGEKHFVGKLPEAFYDTDIGLIHPPKNIVDRVLKGEFDLKYYPRFK